MSTPGEFAHLRHSSLSGIELFSARLLQHRFAKHMHEEYTIGLNDGGLGCFDYRGQTWRSPVGSFNLINPGEIHTGQAEGTAGWTFRNLYISQPRLEQVVVQLEGRSPGLPYFPQPIVWDAALRSLFEQVFQQLCQTLSEPTPRLSQETLLLEFFARLLGYHSQSGVALRSPKPEPQAIALVRAYLEAHYAEPVSIDRLAALVGLSPYYLIRSFRQQVGLSPHSYQLQWQLRQAKRSLHSPAPLSDIAIATGFYDQSHLNRHFKRAFGITPGQYRQGHTQRAISSKPPASDSP